MPFVTCGNTKKVNSIQVTRQWNEKIKSHKNFRNKISDWLSSGCDPEWLQEMGLHHGVMCVPPSPPQRSMQKVWSWRPSNSTGSRAALTSSPGAERKTTFPSLKEAGNATDSKQRQKKWLLWCFIESMFFFLILSLLKMFLLGGEPSRGEAEAVDRNQLWPHRHHRTWVPTCSGLLARAVQVRSGRLRQDHVGPHLGG